MEKESLTCVNCSNEFDTEDTVDENGDIYCNECHSDCFMQCHSRHCYNTFKSYDAIWIGDVAYCRSCVDNNYTYVDCCEDYIRNSATYSRGNGDCYCEEHFYERFSRCGECDETFENDEINYIDGVGYRCDNCSNKTVKEYNFKPPPIFHKLVYENTMFMGIELEVETDEYTDPYEGADNLSRYLQEENISELFYMKNDSSLQDDDSETTGFELVSHPATLAWWHRNKVWYKVLSWLKKNKFKSYRSGRCGLHVHVNKNAFTDRERRKLLLFFWNNREWIKVFSMRDTHYAKFDKYPLKYAVKNPVYNDSRHAALNFSNRDTIEFRTFRGTLNHDRFTATLQFVDAVSLFVKSVSVKKCGDTCFSEFMEFCKHRYGHLHKYLKTLDDINGLSKPNNEK